jgi:hypothetical protein
VSLSIPPAQPDGSEPYSAAMGALAAIAGPVISRAKSRKVALRMLKPADAIEALPWLLTT